MEIVEFVEETARIEKFFGKKLDKFQSDIWYQELKSMPISRYRQAVSKCFGKCKFMPRLADIVSISESLPFIQSNSNPKQKVQCDKCRGEGFILYHKIITDGDRQIDYEYLARCDCQNGLEFAYDGTRIKDTQHRSKYYIPSVQQLGI